MAAVRALARLAKEPVPEQVNIAYDETRLSFGKEYIIPKPFDPRLIAEIPPEVAKAAMESGVATAPIEDWDRYKESLQARLGNDQKLIRLLHTRAKTNPKTVVFTEADQMDVLKAAQIVLEEGIAEPILLGREDSIRTLMKAIDFDQEVRIVDPKADNQREKRKLFAELFWKEQKRKGKTVYDAQRLMRERNYFGSMMVKTGDVDAMISGYSRNYPQVIKPILETLGKAKGVQRVAATNLMLTEQGPLFLSDTSINIDPSSKELAKIAKMTAKTAQMCGLTPVMALLSFSNFGSNQSEQAKKVSEAVSYLHRFYPDLAVDGPLQADFATNPNMMEKSFPFSKLVNSKVNTLIFPNLDSANITYKLMKELNGTLSVGPIMMGLAHPVHTLQLGASVEEIVNMTAVAVVDSQQRKQTSE